MQDAFWALCDPQWLTVIHAVAWAAGAQSGVDSGPGVLGVAVEMALDALQADTVGAHHGLAVAPGLVELGAGGAPPDTLSLRSVHPRHPKELAMGNSRTFKVLFQE